MIDRLLDIARSLEFEEDDVTFSWRFVRWEGSDLVLGLLLAGRSVPIERLLVRCRRAVKQSLALGHIDSLTLTREHFLLWPHDQPTADLFFNGKAADPASVLGSLLECHRRLVGSWLPFQCPGTAFLEVGFGKIARGPLRLIEAYGGVLEQFRLLPSITTFPSQAGREKRTFGVLIWRRGEDMSYVVAEDFTAERDEGAIADS